MSQKSLMLISTGGTIACKPTPQGLAPALSAQDMLDACGITQSIKCCDLFSMDSSNVQPEEWLTIASKIHNVAACGDISGIVLTHGTDTMAYTSSMLSFLLRDIKIPVVITGSQYPVIMPDSDGRANLSDAICAAASLSSGVYICFGGHIIKGCRAVKTHTLSAHAFESINYPYIGAVKDGVFTLTHSDSNDCDATAFEMTGNIDPNVALIKLIPGTSPKLIESVKDCGITGVVVESFGLGGVHNIRRDHNEALKSLMESNIAVVLTSQCLYEASSLGVYAVSRTLQDAGAISAYDMTTEAVVTKLMWALGQTRDLELLQKIMQHSFCGEVMTAH